MNNDPFTSPHDTSFLGWDTFLEFKRSYFEKYLRFIEAYINTESSELEKEWDGVKDGLENAGQDYREWVNDMFAEKGYELSEISQLMYQSFVVSVFIFLEQTLVDFCRHLQRDHNQTFTYADMKGQGVGKCIHYIETVLDRKFPFNDGTRTYFTVAREIRNSLVHREGRLDKPQIKLIQDNFPQGDVLSVRNDQVVLSSGYASSLINLTEIICKELRESCEPLNTGD